MDVYGLQPRFYQDFIGLISFFFFNCCCSNISNIVNFSILWILNIHMQVYAWHAYRRTFHNDREEQDSFKIFTVDTVQSTNTDGIEQLSRSFFVGNVLNFLKC